MSRAGTPQALGSNTPARYPTLSFGDSSTKEEGNTSQATIIPPTPSQHPSRVVSPTTGNVRTISPSAPLPKLPEDSNYYWGEQVFDTVNEVINTSAAQFGVQGQLLEWFKAVVTSISGQQTQVMYSLVANKIKENKKSLEDLVNESHCSMIEDTQVSLREANQLLQNQLDELYHFNTLKGAEIQTLKNKCNQLQKDKDDLYSSLKSAQSAFAKLEYKVDGLIRTQSSTQNNLTRLTNLINTPSAPPTFTAPLAPSVPLVFTAPPAPLAPVAPPAAQIAGTSTPLCIPCAPMPAKFSHNTKEQRFKTWQVDVGLWLNAIRVMDDAQKITFTLLLLEGEAKNVVNDIATATALGQPARTWADLMNRLTAAYQNTDRRSEAQAQIKAATNKNWKTIAEFIAAIQPYIADSGFTDVDLIYRTEQKTSTELKRIVAASSKEPPATWILYCPWIIAKENKWLRQTGKMTTLHHKSKATKDPNAMEINTIKDKPTYTKLAAEQLPWVREGKCLKCGKHNRPKSVCNHCPNLETSKYKGLRFDPEEIKAYLRKWKVSDTCNKTSVKKVSIKSLEKQLAKAKAAAAKEEDSSSEEEEGVNVIKTSVPATLQGFAQGL